MELTMAACWCWTAALLRPHGQGRLHCRLTHDEFANVTDGIVLVRRRRGTHEMAAADHAIEYVRGLGFALRCGAGQCRGKEFVH